MPRRREHSCISRLHERIVVRDGKPARYAMAPVALAAAPDRRMRALHRLGIEDDAVERAEFARVPREPRGIVLRPEHWRELQCPES